MPQRMQTTLLFSKKKTIRVQDLMLIAEEGKKGADKLRTRLRPSASAISSHQIWCYNQNQSSGTGGAGICITGPLLAPPLKMIWVDPDGGPEFELFPSKKPKVAHLSGLDGIDGDEMSGQPKVLML